MGQFVLKYIIEHLNDFDPEDTAYVPEVSHVDLNTEVVMVRFDPEAAADPASPSGYRYFLEVSAMAEVVEGLESVLLRRGTINELAREIIHYAKYDAFTPVEELMTRLDAPPGYIIPELVVIHAKPAWGNRADISIYVPVWQDRLPDRWEELRAQRSAKDEYIICCVPFFAGVLSLGDTVKAVAHEGNLVVTDRIRSAGHNTWHVFFSSASSGAGDAVVAHLESEGILYERYSADVLSVDQADPLEYARFADFFRRMRESYFVIANLG